MTGGPRRRGRYHHGDLPSTLIEAGVEQLARVGPARFSVAEVARRVGVSTAAPYRHFADRDGFLAAVAARAAERLDAVIADAVAAVGNDPRERLAAAAGGYAAAVAAHRVGFDTIFAPALREARDPGLAAAGRSVMERFLDPARELLADPESGLRLVEQIIALAHGYGALDTEGFLTADRVSAEPTAVRASRAVRALVDGVAGPAVP